MSPTPQPARRALNVLAGPMLRSQPDDRIIELYREGHARAFDEIDRRYRVRLRAYAASIAGASSADDIVQDAFSRAARSLKSNDNEINLRPWLYRVVRNTSLNALRDAPPTYAQLDDQLDPTGEPAQLFEQREALAEVLAAMQKLPVNQRQAIVLRELEGMGHADIAAEIETSEGSVRQLIYRARTSLRDAMGAMVPYSLVRVALGPGGTVGPALAGGIGGAGLSGATGSSGGALLGGTFAKAAATVLVAGAAVGGGVAVERVATHGPASSKAATVEQTTGDRTSGSGQTEISGSTQRSGKSIAPAGGGTSASQDRPGSNVASDESGSGSDGASSERSGDESTADQGSGDDGSSLTSSGDGGPDKTSGGDGRLDPGSGGSDGSDGGGFEGDGFGSGESGSSGSGSSGSGSGSTTGFSSPSLPVDGGGFDPYTDSSSSGSGSGYTPLPVDD